MLPRLWKSLSLDFALASLGEGGFKSINRKKRAAATSGVPTSRFAQIRKTLIWLPSRLAEGGF